MTIIIVIISLITYITIVGAVHFLRRKKAPTVPKKLDGFRIAKVK